MTSEREQEGNVPNPFLNAIAVWQNYLIYWIEMNRNFYENAIKTNEQSFKVLIADYTAGREVSQELQ